MPIDTMVHRFHARAKALEHRPALWSMKNGSYLPTSWLQYERHVKHFALGLISLGFPAGSRLCVMGFNREEWLVADVAAMAAGGVPVGIYTTSSPEQVQYIVSHSEAPIVLVENEGYLDRLLSVRKDLPQLKEIIIMDAPVKPRPGVLSYAQVLELGAAHDPAEYQRRVDALDPNALATLIYTSGTTGHPKGVMLSHHNLTWTADQLLSCGDFLEDETLISYLPLSHIAEQTVSIHIPITRGFQLYFAESFDKLPANLTRARPTIFFGVPRVWEKFKAKAEVRMAEQKGARKRMLDWARRVALDYNAATTNRTVVSLRLEAEYKLAQRIVLSKLKERIGFENAHVFVTSAAPIGRDVLDFFASLDIVIREVYGQSEVTGPTTVNTELHTRLGTLGQPMPGVEVRIAEDGEICARGDNVCLGYFKDAEATAQLIQNGWLHSGDVGELDADGYLRVTGRKKEIIVTSGGKKTAPSNIEAMVKAIEPVGNVMVVGDNRNYLVALIALDPERVEEFARARGWPHTAAELAVHPAFRKYLSQRLEADVNPKLSRFETIKRFDVLPHDFTVEGGELTSTLKLRRKVTEQKHRSRIEALYAEGESKEAAA
jgi:long-chain acyl-CoA synthetase